jgi:hypothetical protein
MENKSHGPNSFVIGVAVGVLLTLLFTTKKGRRILATLTDEGLNRFTELEKAMRSVQKDAAQAVDTYSDEEMDDEMEPTGSEHDVSSVDAHQASEHMNNNGATKKTHSIGRRFFRGTRKHL